MGKKKEKLLKFVLGKLEGIVEDKGGWVSTYHVESLIKELREIDESKSLKVGDTLVCCIGDMSGYTVGVEYTVDSFQFGLCIIDDDGDWRWEMEYWKEAFTIKKD